jgi:hypothetical protein
MHRAASRGNFLVDCPANPGRGLEYTRYLDLAKMDFVDQADVDSWVTARGGTTSDWVFVDLYTAGIR